MQWLRDWRLWLGVYVASASLYYLSMDFLPRLLRPWLFYASLATCVVSASLLAALQPLVIVAAPLAVVASLLSYLRYGLVSSLPLLALGVSSVVPFAEARARLRKALGVRFARQVRALYLGDAVLAAPFGADLVLGLLLIARSGEALSMLSGLVVATYGALGLGVLAYDILRLQLATSIEPYSTKWFVAIWFRSRALRAILESYASRLRELIERAGITEAPIVLAARVLTVSMLILAVAPATLCASIALPTEIAYVAFLGTVATSATVLIAPFLYLHSRVGDRRREVEDELPWFVLLAAILQRVGIPLHYAFKRLIGRNILPALEKEARILNKYVHLLGLDAVSALEELARKHPSREFRNLLSGYTSILRTGGDLAAYLESKLFEQLRALQSRLRRFADSALGVGELLIVLYLIFSSILAVAGGGVPDIANLFTVVVCPVVAVAMIGYVSTIQPRTVFRYFIDANHVAPALATAAVAVAALLGGLRGWLSLSLAFLAIGLGYGVQYSYGLSRARAMEGQLIDFLRDLTEMRKIGFPPSQAIQRIARTRSYGEPLDGVIRSLAHQLSLAIPLSEAVEKLHLPSWLARFVLFTLGEIEASGGGSVRVLEMLANFIEEYMVTQREMRSRLRVYEILMALSPVVLGAIVSVSAGMARALAEASAHARNVPIPIRLPSPSAAEQLKLLVVGSTASMAIVASKAIDGSVKSLLRLAIATIALTIYGIWLDPLAQSIAMHMMAGLRP